MKDIKHPVIYRILNTIDGKIYIGSAINYKKRWAQHSSQLNRGIHVNEHLQNAYNKYGKSTFIFEILENINRGNIGIDEFKKFILSREQYYLDTILYADKENNLFFELGYNKCRIAGNNLGLKMSDKARKNISESHMGIKPTIKTRKKMSKSITIAKRESDYIFTKQHKQNISKSKLGKKLKESHKLNISKNNAHNTPCIQYTKDGIEIKKWDSMAVAANELSIIPQHISSVCRGKRSFAGKFIWKYGKEA